MDSGVVVSGLAALIAAAAAITGAIQARAAVDALAEARKARDDAAKHERGALDAASRAALAQERSASALEQQAAIAEEATAIARRAHESDSERTLRQEREAAQTRRRELAAPVIEWQGRLSDAILNRQSVWTALVNSEARSAAVRLNLDGDSLPIKRAMDAAIQDADRAMRVRGPDAPQRYPRFLKARERRIARTRLAFARVVRAWVDDPEAAASILDEFLAEHPKQWDRNWKDEFKE